VAVMVWKDQGERKEGTKDVRGRQRPDLEEGAVWYDGFSGIEVFSKGRAVGDMESVEDTHSPRLFFLLNAILQASFGISLRPLRWLWSARTIRVRVGKCICMWNGYRM
jgi:hypothetical protein